MGNAACGCQCGDYRTRPEVEETKFDGVIRREGKSDVDLTKRTSRSNSINKPESNPQLGKRETEMLGVPAHRIHYRTDSGNMFLECRNAESIIEPQGERDF